MQKRLNQKVFVITGIILLIAGVITVFFNIPYSKTKTEFSELIDGLLTKTPGRSSVFTEGDIAHLPLPVQKYFRYCGYIGTPKMNYMKAIYKDVDFLFGKDKSTIKIDYTQYNFANKPVRIAYIDSSMHGIPFEGLDSYTDGKGSMKGVLAKLFTLFNQTGEIMDKASLVTCLSECLSTHWFKNIHEARELIEAWRSEYNNIRPHSALNNLTPAEYAKILNQESTGLTLDLDQILG